MTITGERFSTGVVISASTSKDLFWFIYSPSFTVNDEKEFYHCFSSAEHGDIFWAKENKNVFSKNWVFECMDFVELTVDGDNSNKKWLLYDASFDYEISGYREGDLVKLGILVLSLIHI